MSSAQGATITVPTPQFSKEEQTGIAYAATSLGMLDGLVKASAAAATMDSDVLVYSILSLIEKRVKTHKDALNKRIKAAMAGVPVGDDKHSTLEVPNGTVVIQNRTSRSIDSEKLLELVDREGISRDLVGHTTFVIDEDKVWELVKSDALGVGAVKNCVNETTTQALVVKPNERIPEMITKALTMLEVKEAVK